ncbi:hypothetical protein [Streptomyces palmae]|uniref:DsrE family protein n=1 Tax=Streptomyces palmae TaxID=1701085 RepID=A0A4Z0HK50_9ACTN|nr:hypothetical protein [Streptomyces palmae]TGB19338.1 hypothetical protein E4099_00440 [Streptomyces palmae]
MTAPTMSYLLVESQVGHASERFVGDALALAAAGGRVRLFLVADAVAAAVRGASEPVAAFTAAGGELWVDGFTLAQRAIPRRVLADAASVVDMDRVAAELTAAGTRVVWH